jgi:hypothetical protein
MALLLLFLQAVAHPALIKLPIQHAQLFVTMPNHARPAALLMQALVRQAIRAIF